LEPCGEHLSGDHDANIPAKCAGFAQFAGESRTSKDSLLEGVEFELSGDFLNGQ
jgi:hypothetical protein